MKGFFNKFIAIFFPWLAFLMMDNLGAALVSLVMQATLIGWIPAAMWALKSLKQYNDENPEQAPKPKQTKQDLDVVDKDTE